MLVFFYRWSLVPALGGAETLSLQLMSELQARGHRVVLLSNDRLLIHQGGKLGFESGQLFAGWEPTSWWALLISPLTFLYAAAAFLLSVLRHGRPKVVYCTSLTEKLFITPWALLLASRVIWIEHTRLGRWFYQNPYLFCYRFLSRRVQIIAPSYFLRDQLLKAGIPITQITIVYPGTSKASAHTPNRTNSKKHYQIGFLGRLAQEKGVNVLLQALPLLHVNFICKIAGVGPEALALQTTAKKLGLQNRVEFFGSVDNPREFLIQLDVLVVPSVEAESFGLVVIEAMALGVPVIASRIGALPEIVEHEKTGLLVEPGSSIELANALVYLRDYPQVASSLRDQALHMVESRFGLERYLEDIYNLTT